MKYNIDTANYADLKTLEDRVRRTLYAHGFNENTSTPLGDMNSLCRNLVQDAAATDAELATLQAKLAESEAQRAVLVGALGGFVGLVENNWKGMEGVFYDPMPTCEQLPEAYLALQNALASQPPSDLVALVKAVGVFRQHEGRCQTNQDAGNLKDHVVRRLELLGETYAALDALLTNQPGFRALIDREDV